jgi:peptidyl-tRNA hydrolase
MRPPKLFLVTRDDLPVPQQAVQSCHAMREFSEEHPEIDRSWYRESNHLALLAVPDEAGLKQLADEAKLLGFKFSLFREPDRNDELTAVALEPRAKRLCRGLPLALR